MGTDSSNLNDTHRALAGCVQQIVPVPEDELMQFCNLFRVKHVPKGQHVFEPGRLINYIYFVEKGCLQLYHQQPGGSLQTLCFYEEYDFAIEMYSFMEGQPTTLHLQAVEDCTLLAINRTHWNMACIRHTWYPAFHHQHMAQQLEAIRQYFVQLKSLGAARYFAQLAETRPALLQRLPADLLAAYLHITADELRQMQYSGNG